MLLHIQGSYSSKYSSRCSLVLARNKDLLTPDFRNLAVKTRQASKCQSFPLSLKGGRILVDKAEVYLLDHTSDRDLHH